MLSAHHQEKTHEFESICPEIFTPPQFQSKMNQVSHRTMPP